MNKISHTRKRHRHSRSRLGMIANTLLASAGAGSVAFLVAAAWLRFDCLAAFLVAYLAASMVLVINPLWLSGRG